MKQTTDIKCRMCCKA